MEEYWLDAKVLIRAETLHEAKQILDKALNSECGFVGKGIAYFDRTGLVLEERK